ncbi:MAG: arginase family protein, partial [Saprospiraceae bacterium]|nr:arginase family protein [Saprospiraceae bacterium]
MSKEKKIARFDPNGVGLRTGSFIGLPFDEEEAEVVLLSIPWDVTASYGEGASGAPQNILRASSQLDLYDPFIEDAWKMGIYMRPPEEMLVEKNRELRSKARSYIDFLESGGRPEDKPAMQSRLQDINRGCEEMVAEVWKHSLQLMAEGKLVGLIGGDHSCPLGFLQALEERGEKFGVLQIDAHMDLRQAYEGFTYSHASIFYNALRLSAVEKL